jgi:hypothetical protein
MALLVPDASEVLLLKYMLNHTTASNMKLHLFTNNRTPAEGDVLASYTESTGNGYTTIALTGGDWALTTATGTTTASFAQQTFTYTGAEASIYGYYFTNNAADALLWVERFTDGPYAIPLEMAA